MLLTLRKYHGLGNDFLVAVDPAGDLDLDGSTARRVCDRRRGIGADGLIHSTRREQGDFGFRLWNADGSEAQMSGNGVRCLAHALADAGLVDGWAPAGGPVRVRVVTPAGDRAVELCPTADPVVAWGSVAMGEVTVAGEGERCNVGHGQLRVDAGNPHLVVAGADPATLDVAALGPALEAASPGGTNVEFVTLGPGPDEVTMRVWERGVGETEACGTGSCAAAVALHHWGRVGTRVTVHQPGGAALVDLVDAAGSTAGGRVLVATLSGPSERIGSCLVEGASAKGAGVALAGVAEGGERMSSARMSSARMGDGRMGDQWVGARP